MKLPFVPGPVELRAAVDGVRDGVGDALELVPRLGRIVGQVEELVGRAGTLLDRVEAVVGRAEEAVGGAEATLGRADAAIRDVGTTQARADEAITGVGETQKKADDAITAVGRTTARADATLDEAEDLVGRVAPLLGAFEGPLGTLAPSVRRLAATLEPDEVEAMVRLIDQLPGLVTHLEEVMVPVLGSMGNVGEDVHDLVDTMQDLRQVVKGFPGSRLFRRRGAEEIAQDEDADDDEAEEIAQDEAARS